MTCTFSFLSRMISRRAFTMAGNAARHSTCGHPIEWKSGLGRALAMAENAARSSSGLRAAPYALTGVGLIADVVAGAEIGVAIAGIGRDKAGEAVSEVAVENTGEDAASIAS